MQSPPKPDIFPPELIPDATWSLDSSFEGGEIIEIPIDDNLPAEPVPPAAPARPNPKKSVARKLFLDSEEEPAPKAQLRALSPKRKRRVSSHPRWIKLGAFPCSDEDALAAVTTQSGDVLLSWKVPKFQTKFWKKTYSVAPRRDPAARPEVEWKGVNLKPPGPPELWVRFVKPLFTDGQTHPLKLAVGKVEMEILYDAPLELK